MPRRGAYVFGQPQSSSGPPLTPTLGWYDPSNAGSVTSSGGIASAITDLSAAGNNLASVAGPQTGVNTLNSLNVFTVSNGHGGTSPLKTAGNVTQALPITVLMVVQFLATPGTQLQQFLVNVSANPALITDGSGHWGYFAGSVIGSATAVDANPHVLGAVFNGASSVLYLDGTSISTSNPGSDSFSGTSSPIAIGNRPSGAGSTDYKQGETLMYASALSAPNFAAQQAYLKAKWATT